MTSPHLTAKQHRALAMLATAGRDGPTQASLDAHGFDASLVVGLLNCGLATTMYDRVPAGGETVEVTKVRISEKGRAALAAED